MENVKFVDQIRNIPDTRPDRDKAIQKLVGNLATLSGEKYQETLNDLILLLHDGEDPNTRQDAEEILKKLWDSSWKRRGANTIIGILEILSLGYSENELEMRAFVEARQTASEWLGNHAAEIAREERYIQQVMNQLFDVATEDPDVIVRETARVAIQDFWRAEWEDRTEKDLPAQRRLTVFNTFLRRLHASDDPEDDWLLQQEAAQSIGKIANQVIQDPILLERSLEALERRAVDDQEILRKTATEAMQKIWNAAWLEQQPLTLKETILTHVLKNLRAPIQDLDGTPYPRKTAAEWLKSRANQIAENERMLDKALSTLAECASREKENLDVRRSAREASKFLWDAGWTLTTKKEGHEELDSRRNTVIKHVLSSLSDEEDSMEDREFRQDATIWLGSRAAELVGYDRILGETLEKLTEKATLDHDEYTQRSAEQAVREIWDAGWKEARTRPIILRKVLNAIRDFGEPRDYVELNGTINRAAADWLGKQASEIVLDERMITDTLNALFQRINQDPRESVRWSCREASQKIWDAGWEKRIRTFDPSRIRPGVSPELRSRRGIILHQVLNVVSSSKDDGFRLDAANWLGDQAEEIGTTEQMVTSTLRTLFARIKEDQRSEVIHSSREASRKIWNEGWKSEPLAVFERVLKAVEAPNDYTSGDRIFRLAAITWFGEKDKAKDIAERYDEMAERVAEQLDIIRMNEEEEPELRESAARSLSALWAALGKVGEHKAESLIVQLDKLKRDEDRDRIIRRLANENTIGSRTAVGLLVSKWIYWLASEENTRLVELTAEELRDNSHAILPLIEHFTGNLSGPLKEVNRRASRGLLGLQTGRGLSEEEKTAIRLRVRRRLIRQLADMSDPRFFDTRTLRKKHKIILRELRQHVVPELVRLLPEEKDVDVLENITRLMAYSKEREAIQALTKEIIGDDRTRKARQELLATYYLEPSKTQSDQAAEILRKAVNESKRTVRLLQFLNSLVVLIGLAVLILGLYISAVDPAIGNRVAGFITGLGGLATVVFQLIRRPMDRIQNANSNLVQMETAFTSFIWELNLNGTFIQSSYVEDGELKDTEIQDTVDRIEEAMKLTMNLVSVHTEEGQQRLVTRLTNVAPAAGKPGDRIVLFGQHLRGDISVNKARSRLGVSPGNAQPSNGTIPEKERAQTGGKDIVGMIALDHLPVVAHIEAWEEQRIVFDLPDRAYSSKGTVWISLIVDGIETNALPFRILQPASGAPTSDPEAVAETPTPTEATVPSVNPQEEAAPTPPTP
jgi:hypothetical protein